MQAACARAAQRDARAIMFFFLSSFCFFLEAKFHFCHNAMPFFCSREVLAAL